MLILRKNIRCFVCQKSIIKKEIDWERGTPVGWDGDWDRTMMRSRAQAQANDRARESGSSSPPY